MKTGEESSPMTDGDRWMILQAIAGLLKRADAVYYEIGRPSELRADREDMPFGLVVPGDEIYIRLRGLDRKEPKR